jgi:hypothetical protein
VVAVAVVAVVAIVAIVAAARGIDDRADAAMLILIHHHPIGMAPIGH